MDKVGKATTFCPALREPPTYCTTDAYAATKLQCRPTRSLVLSVQTRRCWCNVSPTFLTVAKRTQSRHGCDVAQCSRAVGRAAHGRTQKQDIGPEHLSLARLQREAAQRGCNADDMSVSVYIKYGFRLAWLPEVVRALEPASEPPDEIETDGWSVLAAPAGASKSATVECNTACACERQKFSRRVRPGTIMTNTEERHRGGPTPDRTETQSENEREGQDAKPAQTTTDV